MDRDQEDLEGFQRSRKLTEKGLEYTREVKGKLAASTFRELYQNYKAIQRDLEASEPCVEVLPKVRSAYSGWLETYDKLYEVRTELEKLLISEEEKFRFNRSCEDEDKILAECKSFIEGFLLKCEACKAEAEDATRKTVISSKKFGSRSCGSHASNISAALLKEKQVQAELAAKAKVLKEKQRLIVEEQKIKLKQEELELHTQIAASEAKTKVLNEFELEMNNQVSQVGSDNQEQQFDVESQGLYVASQISGDVIREKLNPLENPEPMSVFVHELRKPVPHIQNFDGDPLEFKKFIRQFRSRVIQNTSSDDERMNYLEQFTIGDAHKIVKGFSYLDAKAGYKAAMAELEERYGDENAIASALIQKALKWPNIRPDDSKGLDQYAIFLVECSNAVASMSAVKVLEYPDNLRKIVMKLPFYFHDKWRNKVLRLRSGRKPVEFQHLVEFVKTEAKKAVDPIFGKTALQVEKSTKTLKKTRSVNEWPKSAFSTCANERKTNSSVPVNDSGCLYCNEKSHSVGNCGKFRSISHEEKLIFLMSKGVCFRCLKVGHISKNCDLKAMCDLCKGNHQTILHIQTGNRAKVTTGCTDLNDTCPVMHGSPMEAGICETGECTLAIVPVKVSCRNGLKVVSTYAFLDSGSTVSFCTNSLIDTLGCKGKHKKITIDTMGQSHTLSTFATDDIQIHDLDMNNVVHVPSVYSKESLPVTTRHIPTETDVKQWSHLSDITLPQIDAGIDLLIGGNVADAYTPLEIRTGPSGSPHASRTRIGWVLWNVVRPIAESPTFPCVCTDVHNAELVEKTKCLEQMIEKTLKFDFPESQMIEKREMSQEDKRFVEIAENSIEMNNGQYSMKLPFRDPYVEMPDNREQAFKRLKGLKKKFVCNPQFYEDYCVFMSDILEKGYAEQVPDDELEGQRGQQWYIPHHGVYHPHKFEKIRVVFDCSATYQGVSLNNVLLPGPNLTNNLVDVLLMFRQENIAVMGDVESMFYRVKVSEEDIDFQRFYWWPNGNYSEEPRVFRMLVHMFGTVSSPSCATFALQQTARDNRSCYSYEACDLINSKFYVDDCLFSKENEDEAVNLVKDVTALCQKGGFRLTKWCSNSLAVIGSVPENERAKDVKCLNLDRDPLPNERALGVFWFLENETIGYKVSLKSQPDTRRGILSVVSSVYDPLGFVGPFVLVGKQILQKLCKSGIDWDEKIDDDTLKSWKLWKDSLPALERVFVRRCYRPVNFGQVTSCQLHIFADASEVGYGVAIYLRFTNSNNDVCCALVMSKSRVAPLKRVTIPRLELTAATVAVRLSKVVESGLECHIDKTVFWTDSMSVLRYISNESCRFKTFVANRITVIRDGSDPMQWNYLPSKLNPADLASRGVTLEKLLQNKQWFSGPDFLWNHESTWPQAFDTFHELDDKDPEIKKPVCSTTENSSEHKGLDKLIHYYSSWTKLKKAVGWLFLFTKFLKSKGQKIPCESEFVLNTEVLDKAEMIILRHTQLSYFPTELKSLQDKDSPRVLKSSQLSRLNPVLVDGILRVGGRLARADIGYEARHPIILPKKSPVSDLILHDVHKRVGHLGRNAMLSNLHTKYWILGAGAAVKRIVSRCVICRKYQAPACQQMMSDMPEDRVQAHEPPFTNTGMDFFGPFVVKRGRASVKRYGVIFTCLNVRAVHLELAHNLDTDSCINAIRRFVARRGPPKIMRSDNGTNLVGAERELREQINLLNKDKIHSSLLEIGINWMFNPPLASHFGGVWERMIRSVRKVLYSIMQEQVIHLDDEGLSTLFCEVEAILNGRPLTTASSDPNDVEPLTPNHLLLLRSRQSSPPGVFNKDDIYSRKRWRHVQYLADLFWKRWTKEYLSQLQMRQKWISPKRNVTHGDIVLLIDNAPRHAWAIGRVIDVQKDKNGLVRAVKVKTADSEFVRPVSKLSLIMESPDCEK